MGALVIKSKKFGEKTVLFDDEDYNIVTQYKTWILHKRNDTFYVYAQINCKSKRMKIYMHRLVMHFPERKDVDHKDGDGLNNQKLNLRAATRSQNLSNQKIRPKNTTGFKGVNFDRRTNNYFALLLVNRKRKTKCGFTNPIDAAKAYNELAAKHFGEFANLNPI